MPRLMETSERDVGDAEVLPQDGVRGLVPTEVEVVGLFVESDDLSVSVRRSNNRQKIIHTTLFFLG